MNQRVLRLLLPMLILVMGACGSGGGNGQPGPGEPGPGEPGPGEPAPPFSSRLVAEGSSYIHTLDLTAGGEWQQRLRHSSVYGAVAVHLPANEPMLATVSMSAPLRVAVHDLGNFGLKRSFVWPDSADPEYNRIDWLAVSPDGRHFAAVIDSDGADFVEVIDSGTSEVKFKGSLALAGNDLHWLDNETLAFSAHLTDTQWAGGIVGASLEDLADDGETISIGIILPFTAGDWALDQPSDFAFSPDMRQLAYSYNSDIWLKDLTDSEAAPQQLTTGPNQLAGPTFSPDGTHLALVERRTPTRSDTFVIPLNHTDPLFINGPDSDEAAVVLEAATLVDTMLVWQP